MNLIDQEKNGKCYHYLVRNGIPLYCYLALSTNKLHSRLANFQRIGSDGRKNSVVHRKIINP